MQSPAVPELRSHAGRWASRLVWLFVAPALYVLSSGPVLAIAFWLREATNQDEFYLAMWLYFPLLWFGHGNWIDAYISWWVWLIGAPGPG